MYEWFPFFPVKYRRATLDLTLEQDGAYRRLIDEYMIDRKPLPDDDQALARIVGCTLEHWLEEIAPKVRPYFKVKNGRLVNQECEDNLRAQELRSQIHRENGRRGGKKRWAKNNNLNGNANSPAVAKRYHTTLQDKIIPSTTTSEYGAARGSLAAPDGARSPPTKLKPGAVRLEVDSPGWLEWVAYLGTNPPVVNGGWYFESEHPPASSSSNGHAKPDDDPPPIEF